MLLQFQKVEDYEVRPITHSDDALINDDAKKRELLTVFGFYWRLMVKVDTYLERISITCYS